MAKLPYFDTEDLSLSLLQEKWATIIEPVLNQPHNQAVILKGVVLSSSGVINHTLGRKLVGWHIIRQRGDATVYDSQDTNSFPDKTLLLRASSGVSVDILCF